MPSSPLMCMGKNARLKPTKKTQKLALPRRSLSSRPVILGSQ
jgi:hypothetical protein